MKKLFEEVKSKGDKTARLLKTERKKKEKEEKAKAEAAKEAELDGAIAAQIEEEKKEEPENDPNEFLEEKDLVKQFDEAWQEACAGLKVWQEKKAKLEEINTAVENFKVMQTTQHESLVGYLKKECGVTNINIAMAAISASTALAKGYKKNFSAGTKVLIDTIMLKFKEKRPMVQDLVNKFLDTAITCTDIENISEPVFPLITNVAPGVKLGTIKFIERIAVVTYIDVLQRVQGELLPQIMKAIDDKDGGVRDSALHCMGLLKGRLGESVTEKYLKNLNP